MARTDHHAPLRLREDLDRYTGRTTTNRHSMGVSLRGLRYHYRDENAPGEKVTLRRAVRRRERQGMRHEIATWFD